MFCYFIKSCAAISVIFSQIICQKINFLCTFSVVTQRLEFSVSLVSPFSADWRSYRGTRTSRLLLRLTWYGLSSYPPSFMPVQLDLDSRTRKKDPSHWDEMLYETSEHFLQGPCDEREGLIQNAAGVHYDLLTMVKKRKLRWYGHISRSSGMAEIL